MTKSQAHKNITTLAQYGLISDEEASYYRVKIERIAASSRSWKQKAALYAVWGC